jgi:hypothetical protein
MYRTFLKNFTEEVLKKTYSALFPNRELTLIEAKEILEFYKILVMNFKLNICTWLKIKMKIIKNYKVILVNH